MATAARPPAPWEVAAEPAGAPVVGLRWGIVLPLVLALALFGQVFAYVKAIPPLWALAKAWPVLSLPFALVLFRYDRPPVSRQIAFTFLWLLLVSSIAGSIVFHQSFFLGLTSQVKLLPILSFFSLLGLLCLLKPTLKEITAALLIGGIATLALLCVFWLIAPQSWYSETYEAGDAPIFSRDSRGNRIRWPMFLALVTCFWCLRSFVQTRRTLWLAAAALIFAIAVGIVRQRAIVVGLAGTAAVLAVMASGPWLRVLMVALSPLALWGLLQLELVASIFSNDAKWGFDTRRISIEKASAFLGHDPFKWIFGVGSLSPLDPAAMWKFFNHFFFLADITWLGVTFEFGLIGALMIVMLPVRGIVVAHRLRRGVDAPIIGAMQDYLVYAIIISPLYPLTLTPGEVTMILAVLVYIRALLPMPYEELYRR